MSRSSSNLRVFVNFKEDTVFAGEDVECTITFKNVAATRRDSERATNGLSTLNGSGRGAAVLQQFKTSRTPLRPGLGRHPSNFAHPSSRAVSHGHTENIPLALATEAPSHDLQRSPVETQKSPSKSAHSRSVSIISISSTTEGTTKDADKPAVRTVKAESTAVRSAAQAQCYSSQNSFQNVYDITDDDRTIQDQTVPFQQSADSPPDFYRGSGRADDTAQHASQYTGNVSPHDTRYPSPVLERQTINRQSNRPTKKQLLSSPERTRADNNPLQIKKTRSENKDEDFPTVDARKSSVFSNEETPRPSFDLYNLNNRSDETLMSELPSQSDRPGIRRGQSSRQSSFFTVNKPPMIPKKETLMMGYVQVSGSFILDGSLVNRVPFEEVKQKAVVGGQAGGGVVGVTRRNRDSGFFGALNLGSIGESIGDLLGSGQPSSMREMKDIADSESIPLLATPKSILFVNLELDPGQSRSFEYKYKMPRGLPPSHRGRAIKVTYNIMIGTQRPGISRAQAQQMSQISVPFRLFGGVNTHGESLGHDLMSPYIILKEKATITTLSPSTPATPPPRQADSSKSALEAADFQVYVEQLLDASDREQGLLSPTVGFHSQTPRTPLMSHANSGPMSRSTSPPHAAPSVRTLIDHAVRWAGLRHSAIYSPTTFNIARSSLPIAVLKISRSALRLGDLLICVMDFSQAKLPCYALEATLESSERVDPSLAIRSPQSVERVTRRVWARTTECTLGAGRASWSFQIPVIGTPSFATTGVGVEWCVRVEIVVAMQEQREARHSHSRTASTGSAVVGGDAQVEEADEESTRLAGDEDDTSANTPPKKLPDISNALLEVIEADERGALLAPKVRMQAESFEVLIPLRIFGASVGVWAGDAGGAAAREASQDGLPV